MADRRRIVQVLGNLLSNAARYSQEGSPIRLSAALADGHVALTVADQGRGVEPERLPLLFRKFSRSDGGEDREVLGEGLGLSISKGIVEAHGGRIWAESEGVGHGSAFTFTLPVAEGAATGRTRRSPRSRRETRERGRVLAVDDDPATLRNVREVLAGAGYTPLVTGDPDEALRLFEAESPRLVLLDLVLPGSDGIELMDRMLGVADVPVIFLSAYSRDEIIARAKDAGGGGLHGQALLPHRAGGPGPGRPAPAGVPGSGGAARALRAGGPDPGLCRARGQRCWPPGASDPHRVRNAVSSFR